MNRKRINLKQEELIAIFQMVQEVDMLSHPEAKKLMVKIFQSKMPLIEDIQRLKRLIYPVYEKIQIRKRVDPFYKTPRELKVLNKGAFQLGHICTSESITNEILRKDFTNTEEPVITCAGGSGSGKTGFIMGFTRQWIKHGGMAIIFDREPVPRGCYFNQLIHVIPNSVVIPTAKDAEPLLRCPGIDDETSLNDFCDTFAGATSMIASATAMKELLQLQMKQQAKPTLHEFREFIKSMGNNFYKRKDYLDTLTNRITMVCTDPALAPALNYRIGISPATIQKYDLVIYDVSALSALNLYMYVSMKLTHFFRYAERHGLNKPILFVIDEGEYLFSQQRDYASGQVITPPHQTLARRGRKRGLRLIVGTQLPHHLSEEALNSSLLVCFRLYSTKQQRIMAAPLGLTNEQAALLGELPHRYAIARI